MPPGGMPGGGGDGDLTQLIDQWIDDGTPETRRPLADAGDDQNADEGTTVTLDASGSTDLDNNINTHAWLQTGGPNVTLSNSGIAQPAFTAPEVDAGGATLTFSVTITDLENLVGTDSVTVVVQNVESIPNALNDIVNTLEDQPVTIDVLDNDENLNDIPLTVTGQTSPANGQLTIENDNRITYTPDPDFHGQDIFTYRVTDADNESATATATVTVQPVNDTPLPADDEATTDEDQSVTIDVLINDLNIGDGPVTVAIVSRAANIFVEPDNRITYTPTDDFNGPEQFVYRVTDADNESATATVTVTVDPVDDFPVATPDPTGLDDIVAIVIDVLGNDTGLGDGGIDVTEETAPEKGNATYDNDNRITYTPDPGFSGVDVFEYRLTDADGDSAVGTVTVSIALVFQYELLPGWNLLSMPVITETTAAEIFVAQPVVWGWDGAKYIFLSDTDVIAARSGFWVYNAAVVNVMSAEFAGVTPTEPLVLGADSRNLLGPVRDADRPTVNVSHTIWAHVDDRYTDVKLIDQLFVLHGYWIFSEPGGTLDLGE